MVGSLTEDRYGHTPKLRFKGHTDVTLPYIQMPLDYILPEVLKNAMRATVEHHAKLKGRPLVDADEDDLPPVGVTIVSNPIDFIIRISDRGGGIPHDKVDKIMKYNYTTAEESTEKLMEQNIFGSMIEDSNRSTSGPMHG